MAKMLGVTDSTTLDCNWDMGHTNSLFTKVECKDRSNWLFEKSGDTIMIYRDLDPCRDKVDFLQFGIEKELVYTIP